MAELPPNLTVHANFDALASSISNGLNCDVALVSLVQEDALLSMGHSSAPSCFADRLQRMHNSVCARPIETGDIVSLPDMTAHSPPQGADDSALTDIHAYMGLPLWRDGAIVGTLSALSRTPRDWPAQDREFFRMAAKLAESEIDRALLRYEHSALSHALAENDAVIALLSGLEHRMCTVQNQKGELLFAKAALEHELGLGPKALEVLPHLACSVAHTGQGRGELMLDILGDADNVLYVRVYTSCSELIVAEWSIMPRRRVVAQRCRSKLN